MKQQKIISPYNLREIMKKTTEEFACLQCMEFLKNSMKGEPYKLYKG